MDLKVGLGSQQVLALRGDCACMWIPLVLQHPLLEEGSITSQVLLPKCQDLVRVNFFQASENGVHFSSL